MDGVVRRGIPQWLDLEKENMKGVVKNFPAREDLAMPIVEAPEPYNAQIATLGEQVGAVIARQTMKDRSGASVMDPKTQVTSVHGHSVLDMALEPLEAIFALPLVHEIATANDRAMLDVAVAAEVNLVGDPILVATDAARDAGGEPAVECFLVADTAAELDDQIRVCLGNTMDDFRILRLTGKCAIEVDDMQAPRALPVALAQAARDRRGEDVDRRAA